ncbi:MULTISPECIES: disulfide oxidoreductase [Bacillus]|uniref:disulfide oxidoreductase n=1 Tax=Bacillus TaxID=1386 RepID=UPI00036B90FD|nr:MULTISPECIES: disulfide oxidoreductase [Bacillus]
MENKKIENFLFIAWATSIIATFGSLYFSEIRHYIPCDLCWYQRIIMYPFTIFLGIAVVKKDFNIGFYSMILSTVGTCISTYHYIIQKIPSFAATVPSCGRIPCEAQYINWFGFITIPFLALTAFIIIFVCSYIVWKNAKEAY